MTPEATTDLQNETFYSIRISLVGSAALALAIVACSGGELDPVPSDDEAVATSSEAIVNGSTTSLNQRVVKVRRVKANGSADLCTGTLLRSNIVLTANHCVGSTDGGVWRRHYIELVSGLVVEVSNPSSNVVQHPENDLALMKLDQHVSFPTRGGQSFWTPLYEGALSNLEGQWADCQGYGRNVCGGGGSGTLRRAQLRVNDASSTSIEFLPDSSGQIQQPGDSGGPCFIGSDEAQIGVNRTANTESCSVARQTPVKPHSAWIRRQVALMQQNPDSFAFNSQSELTKFDIVDLPGSASAPSGWVIKGNPPLSGESSLVQTSNINGNGGGSIAVVKGNVISDVYVETVVHTTDNDSASIVVRYKNPTNYYRMTVWGDAAPDSSGIYRVKDGVTTKLADCAANLSSETFIVAAASNETLAMIVYGDTDCGVQIEDDDHRDGRIGLMTNGLDEAEFTYLDLVSNPD